MDSLPPEKVLCHHTGFTKRCRALVSTGRCNRWLQIAGKNPNTGEDVSRFDCIDNWTPLLLIENSQVQRQTGAAIESFRNEVVVRQGQVDELKGVGPNGETVLLSEANRGRVAYTR